MNSVNTKRFLDYFVFLFVRLLAESLCIIPEKAAMAFGRFVGRLGYVLVSDRRKAAIEIDDSAQNRLSMDQTHLKNFDTLAFGCGCFRIRDGPKKRWQTDSPGWKAI
jgi:hypothetical protein